MRNFFRLNEGNNFNQLLLAIHRQPELWNQDTIRTTHPHTPHAEVDDILLRFNDLEPYKNAAKQGEYEAAVSNVLDQHESICFPAWYKLPQAHAVIFDLVRFVEGARLGRVIITRLAPGKKITPHVDSGAHADYYERFHVVMQNPPGSIFRAGGEEVMMRAGEIWWFNNKIEHEVVNNSIGDRYVMIVDIRCLK